MQTNFPVSSGTSQNINISLPPAAAQSSHSGVQAVDAEPVIGLKRAAIAQCLTAPAKVPLRLRNIIGPKMPTKVVNNLTRSLKKSDPEQKRKLIESYVDTVFAEAKMNPECLKQIEVALGIQEPTPPPEQIAAVAAVQAAAEAAAKAEAAASSVPTVTEGEYIEGLEDFVLNRARGACEHFQYDMNSGRYIYHVYSLTRLNRSFTSQSIDDALRALGMAFGGVSARFDGHHHNVQPPGSDQTTTHSCVYGQNILNHTNRQECDSLLDGDMLAVRRLALLDVYASNMHSLLNDLQDKIETISLPDKQPFAVRVAVADGYRASYVAQVQQLKDGLHWQREAYPDNLAISNNLLNITFKTKKDLSELIPSGKTLGELEAAGQVVLSLASKYEEADQEALLSHIRGVSIQRENYHFNRPEKVDWTTYTFEDGRFGKGIGGRG